MQQVSYILILLMCVMMFTACRKQEAVLPETMAAATEITEESVETMAETQTETEIPTEETTVPSEMTLPPTEPEPEPMDADFVRITDYIPTAREELFYATEENFTGHVIYNFQEAYLRYGTVKKLMAVSRDLEELGLYIKVWDGFRPVSAQFKLWEILPDPTYVANPNVGYSSHSRGNTIDLTLVDGEGTELEMPTGFDDFSTKADRNYADCTEAAANNAKILESLMEKHGFQGYYGEWWHFSDTVQYPVENTFEPY